VIPPGDAVVRIHPTACGVPRRMDRDARCAAVRKTWRGGARDAPIRFHDRVPLVRLLVVAGATLLSAACHHHAPPSAAVNPMPAPNVVSASPGGDTVATASKAPDTTVTHAEVTQQALREFGDSVGGVQAGGAPGDSSAASADAAAGPTWDIDVRSYATQTRVSHFVSLFSGGARDIFTQWVQRGTRYEPLIRGKLRQAGLPEDMAYLPIIESGYSPHAYSSAAAVGMWQLMTSTARGAGLRVDWWVDERRDPVRSTDAAIRFLRYLKDQFGSIYLAAAAYDGGPGRISRGLARYAGDFEGTTGDDLFFALADKKYLRGETKDYVPQLIAAALVAKEPARYGLHIEPMETYAYDSVRVGPATPLAAIAKASDAPLAAIADLNPFILRGVTPPKDSLTVRVPVGSGAAFDSTYAALPERDRTAFTRITTRKGDGFASIADRSGVSVRHLKWYNPGAHPLKSGRLPVGEVVLVPSAAVTGAALDVPDPAIEKYGSGRGIHIVKSGESLGRIALHYHTTVATLMRLNGLRKSIILPGQALVVSGSATPIHKHRAVHSD
jgi:membrane-bound lytic murein transglycosylase D